MRKKLFSVFLVLGLVCIMSGQAYAGTVNGYVQWRDGSPASVDLHISFNSSNSQDVRSDSSGNFSVSFSGSYDTIKVFFKGDLVYQGSVSSGDSISFTVKP